MKRRQPGTTSQPTFRTSPRTLAFCSPLDRLRRQMGSHSQCNPTTALRSALLGADLATAPKHQPERRQVFPTASRSNSISSAIMEKGLTPLAFIPTALRQPLLLLI